jgi:hypothetical protein
MLCALPLSGKHDGWAHDDCARVVKADDEAHQVTDRRALEVVEREMRAQGLCPHQIRPNGWDGSAIYCGQGIIEHGDKPNLYCLEHECEAWGDEEGAAQERWERTLELLERDRRS